MKIFVTGGNGFIGSAVVRTLIDAGYEVRCLVRRTSNLSRLAGLDLETALGDIRDPLAVEEGMRGCDGVIHLAGLANWKDLQSPELSNVILNGTRHVLDAARNLGCLRTVFVSSAAAVGGTAEADVCNEDSPYCLTGPAFAYAHAKHLTEELCQVAAASGQPVVIVNPAEVYGPQDFNLVTACNLLMLARSNPVIVCRGGTSIVHVDDVAAGILAAFQRGRVGERYILGGDNATNQELAELTAAILGQRKWKITIPGCVLRAIGRIAAAFRIPIGLPPAVIPYATMYWFMDNSKARAELGVTFRSARETLNSALCWLQQAGYLRADMANAA